MIEPASPPIEPASSLDPQPSSPELGNRSASAGKRRRRRNGILAAALLLLVVAVVPPFINISRFRRSIVQSIGAGLGRPVEASAVEIELLPRPGFVLHNLTVGEDPAYGAEPVMMAETVTASLRASTLWHARVEIASLSFDAPSVNLVRNTQGHWNFESLLYNSPALRSRNSSTFSNAAVSGRPMPFPYVQATDARINFKLGPEKLPFSLESADLAVWKESANKWRVRIKARPVRTDLTVMDAGQIRGEGTLIASGALMDAPIRANLEWRHVQLDEISRLLHGKDDGWRGTVDWTANALGTLADVSLESDIAVEEFHRAEFMPATEMDLSAHCQVRYARNNRLLDSLECSAPAKSGRLVLRGFGSPSSLGRRMNRSLHSSILRHRRQAEPVPLQFALQHVPAEFFLDLLGHIHPGIADDATASGELNGNADCDWRSPGNFKSCTGEIRSKEVRLHLAHLDRPLTLSPFLLVSSPSLMSSPSWNHAPVDGSDSVIWKLSPLHVSLGGITPATITGTMTATGSSLQIAGAADLAELDKLAQTLKIPALSGQVQSIRGSAQLALSLKSTWLPLLDTNAVAQTAQPAGGTGFTPSQWKGSLQIHDATLKVATLPRSLQLASAQVNLTPTEVEWTSLHGNFAHMPFDGSVRWQTPCPTSRSACARTFALHIPDLNADYLQAALRKDEGSSGLLNLINPWAGGPPRLPEISGTLNADVLSAGRISLKNVVLQLHIKGHSADLMAISGKIFGGVLSGEGTLGGTSQSGTGSAQWGDGAPIYQLRATLEHIQPDSVAAIWHEHWGRGAANVQIDLKTRGWSAAELAGNANGKFTVAWVKGTLLPPVAVPSANTIVIEKFQRWDAEGIIRNQTLVLDSSQFVPQNVAQRGRQRTQASSVAQSVTGTITFARTLNLHFQPSGISMTGPLDMPVITSDLKSRMLKTQTNKITGGSGSDLKTTFQQ